MSWDNVQSLRSCSGAPSLPSSFSQEEALKKLLLLSEIPYTPSIGVMVPSKTHWHLCVPNSCCQNSRWEMLFDKLWLGLPANATRTLPGCRSPTTGSATHPPVPLLPPEKCFHFIDILQNRWEVLVYVQGEEPASHPLAPHSCNDNTPSLRWSQSQVPLYIINISLWGQTYWQNTDGWLL